MNSNHVPSSSSNPNNPPPPVINPIPGPGGVNRNTRTPIRPRAILGVPTIPGQPIPTLPHMPLHHHSPSNGAFSYYSEMVTGTSDVPSPAGANLPQEEEERAGVRGAVAERSLAEEEEIAAEVERRRGIKIDLNIDLTKKGAAPDDDEPEA